MPATSRTTAATLASQVRIAGQARASAPRPMSNDEGRGAAPAVAHLRSEVSALPRARVKAPRAADPVPADPDVLGAAVDGEVFAGTGCAPGLKGSGHHRRAAVGQAHPARLRDGCRH